mgnify:CR=1 FL=1
MKAVLYGESGLFKTHRMRMRIDVLSEVVFELDATGRIVFLSRAWTPLTGIEAGIALAAALALALARAVHAASPGLQRWVQVGTAMCCGPGLPSPVRESWEAESTAHTLARLRLARERRGAATAALIVSGIGCAPASPDRAKLVAEQKLNADRPESRSGLGAFLHDRLQRHARRAGARR